MNNGGLDIRGDVRFLKGVGPRRAESFAQLGVRTILDLLEYYPRHHEFLPPLCPIRSLRKGMSATIAGEITHTDFFRRRRPPRFEAAMTDCTGFCQLTWFHGGYLQDKVRPGDRIAAWGTANEYQGQIQIINPGWMKLEDPGQLKDREKQGQPIYPAGAGMSSGEIARIIRTSLELMLRPVPELFGEDFLRQRELPARTEALRWIHAPSSPTQVTVARRRLAYDELFLMELGMAMRREQLRQNQPAFPLPVTPQIDQRIRRRFPFPLTVDQNEVIGEICRDMAQSEPMNRLLQGDVGSGKTVVALYASLLAVTHQKQAAIMAPTEILAEQHYRNLEKYLAGSKVRRVLLTGGMPASKRNPLLAQIASHEMDIVVGTQALLQNDVEFHELALVVVDEQHKFGVRQRQRFRGKDIAPHYLVMTATPIPRTLAMTVFGDLDVSTLKHLPPGRREIITRWVPQEKLPDAYEFIRNKVRQGQQAYFVYPRVEEDTEQDAFLQQIKAATTEYDYLRKEIFPELRVGLLHGQMKPEEKQQVMEQFRSGGIGILVATVVIEVGVDVPNATILVIEHAERFGLAQLHQLRGRIGRGNKTSYCLLLGRPGTEESRRRLEIMTETSDGFRIAEEDLRIRGPGEFFGTAQHGLPSLKIADIISDMELLRMAQRDAFSLARTDPFLRQPGHQEIRRELFRRLGDALNLVDVG